MNIDKYISHWLAGSVEDWAVAKGLLNQGKVRHGLFFAHLAVEKMLKAYYCRHQQKLAPMTHNLLRIADGTDLGLNGEQRNLLA